mgnify:FL=1
MKRKLTEKQAEAAVRAVDKLHDFGLISGQEYEAIMDKIRVLETIEA